MVIMLLGLSSGEESHPLLLRRIWRRSLIETTAIPHLGDPDYLLFNEKNKFVYSMWTSRITGGLALSLLRDFEDSKDGRGTLLQVAGHL